MKMYKNVPVNEVQFESIKRKMFKISSFCQSKKFTGTKSYIFRRFIKGNIHIFSPFEIPKYMYMYLHTDIYLPK